MKVHVVWSGDGATTNTWFEDVARCSSQLFASATPGPRGERPGMVTIYDSDNRRVKVVLYAGVHQITEDYTDEVRGSGSG